MFCSLGLPAVGGRGVLVDRGFAERGEQLEELDE
jgi:hypothetical protein